MRHPLGQLRFLPFARPSRVASELPTPVAALYAGCTAPVPRVLILRAMLRTDHFKAQRRLHPAFTVAAGPGKEESHSERDYLNGLVARSVAATENQVRRHLSHMPL